jgi:hypothetical protein
VPWRDIALSGSLVSHLLINMKPSEAIAARPRRKARPCQPLQRRASTRVRFGEEESDLDLLVDFICSILPGCWA